MQESLGSQNSAGLYYMLADVWPVSDYPQNSKYPHVTPETFRDYFKSINALKLEEDKSGYRAFFRGPRFQ